MSKWIKKDLFDSFQKEKIEEKDTSGGGFIRSNLVWDTPARGTVEQAKTYEGRFLPDPQGEFYKRYYYHMWQSGEKWHFVFCPKTYDHKNFCPLCAANSKLYNGTKDDKRQAYLLKRKERNVANFYIVRDNRDDDRSDENKVVGKVKLYEFPGKVEQKVKKEITDRENGYGAEIFDPEENGRNFILNVLATKKDDKGNTWPDYSTSEFSRRQSALGTEAEIEEIMATCIDLKGYMESMETDKDKIVEILKGEFLWEFVEAECLKNGYKDVESGAGMKSEAPEKPKNPKKSKEEEKNDSVDEDPPWDSEDEEKNEPSSESSDSNIDDLDDDALLAELDNM